MGKKRKFEEEDEDDSNNYLTTTNGYLPHNESFKKDYIDQFNQFRSTLCLNEEIEFNSFKKLYDFFKMNVAKPKFMSQIGPLCDIKFITNILWRYNCTLSQKDLLIFDLLNLLENQMYLDFRFYLIFYKF